MPDKNVQLEVFRMKVRNLMEAYVAKTKGRIAENRALGMTNSGIRAIRESETSRWAWDRTTLEKDIKREVSGLINRVHIAAYTEKYK